VLFVFVWGIRILLLNIRRNNCWIFKGRLFIAANWQLEES
jgi:hypothetical protein